MPPGPKPKGAAQKRREGNIGRRPIKDGLPTRGVPVKPDDLSPIADAYWDEVVPDLVRDGAVGKLDTAALTVLCVQWGFSETFREQLKDEGMVEIGSTGQMVEHPLLTAYNRACQLYLRYAEQFGLTSSARQRIEAAKAERAINPFEDEIGRSPRERLRAVS